MARMYKTVDVREIFSGPDKGRFYVQVTFREPCEDLFEIADHIAHFEDRAAADRLVVRVAAAFKEIGLSRSKSFALSADCWNYVSSAFRPCVAKNETYHVDQPKF